MKRNIPTVLLYVLSFLLLWEWLRPVEQLTDTNHLEMFIVFLLIALAVSYFRMKWIWQSIIKLVVILFSINQFHYKEGFFQFSWINSFLIDIVNNLGLLLGREWNHLSNEFRTLLFFILLWLMVYLMEYWLLKRQRIFIFFFITLVYITVLDTFTPYNATAAIVRTVMVGFAVMGMLTFFRISQKEKVDYDASFLRKWMMPLTVMIVVSVLMGYAAPKAAPIWPDPVPYFTANNDKVGVEGTGAGPHRIGYGPNDSALGGPFIGNSQPVFVYEGNGKNYWKMETKDVYTGKGWIASGSTPIPFRQEDLVPVSPFPNTVEVVKESARVIVNGSYNYNFLMYPAGIKKIVKIEPLDQPDNLFKIDTTIERISYYTSSQEPVVPMFFTIDFEVPKYNAVDLMVTTESPTEKNKAFYEKYTSLPADLPPRVKELAEEITAGKTNWFDKASAIEKYFGSSGYTYDQKNVAVPGENDDYVDQFLFETLRGYCDNFSTSMAVMLRTLGIPTRWVKGYTGGDFQEYSPDNPSKQFYEVTNNNAHSWVEVFFPNQGWVPFEPTKGFYNETSINYAIEANSTQTNQQATPSPVKKPQQEQEKQAKSSTDSKKSFNFKTISDTLKTNWKWTLLILLLVTGFVVLLYRLRGKWTPYGVILLYRFKNKDDSIGPAYLMLLKQLERYGLKRKDHQTLRHYARYIDGFFSTREMTRLTVLYEQYIYHQSLPEGTWEESHELWENLIKKTIA